MADNSQIRKIHFVALILILSLFAAFAAVRPGSAQEGNAGKEEILANLENVQLEDFIRFFSKYTGRNVVYRQDEIPDIQFNIHTYSPFSDPELLAIFHHVLMNAGLAAVSKGDALYIYPLNKAKQIPGEYTKSIKRGREDDIITTVYRLPASLAAKEVQGALAGLTSRVGSITPIPQARSLIISDLRDRVDTITDIIDSIGAISSDWDYEVVRLEQASAANVAALIKDMYSQLKERGELAEMPLIAPIEWNNSLLVSGPPGQKDKVREFLVELDKVDKDDEGNIRIYTLQNAKAEPVAEVLQSLMEAKIEQDKEQQEGKKGRVTELDIFKASSDSETNSVLVLTSKDLFPQIENIIERLDKPQDQVYCEVLVMETSLTNARRFGVEWLVGAGDSGTVGQVGFIDSTASRGLFSYAEPALEGGRPGFESLPGGFSLGVLGNMITYQGETFPTISALIDFTKSISEINILSTPQIMTLNHNEAEVFVGENRPFVTSEKFDANNNPVQTFDYRDVGIKLQVTPHVNNKDDLIRLDIFQEVKKLATNADPNTTQPITLTRYTKTSVQIMDGATIVISGLIQDDSDKGKTGMPGLANIPVLGWLFKRERATFEKRTMMVFMTARVIHTLERARELTRQKEKIINEELEETDRLYKDEFTWGGSEVESESKIQRDLKRKLDEQEIKE
jgi:general secretion pathway protein D